MPEPPDPALGLHVVGIVPVDAAEQDGWIEAHSSIGPLATVPGLMSLRLFRSVDGTTMLFHMWWESPDAFAEAEAQGWMGPATSAARLAGEGVQGCFRHVHSQV